MERRPKAVERYHITTGDDLNAAVSEITYESGQSLFPGMLKGEVAKADALDASAHQEAKAARIRNGGTVSG
jgi:hypothetical protein